MRIRLTQTVEDSVKVPVQDETGAFVIDEKSGEIKHQPRVDLFRAGEEHDVPEVQGRRLVSLGYAEEL